jgi:hypothetical protein
MRLRISRLSASVKSCVRTFGVNVQQVEHAFARHNVIDDTRTTAFAAPAAGSARLAGATGTHDDRPPCWRQRYFKIRRRTLGL